MSSPLSVVPYNPHKVFKVFKGSRDFKDYRQGARQLKEFYGL